jgi:branched-chain amino acid transport system permease protein
MQIAIQGALISGLYALIAVGFTMIYGVGRVENLAHGAYIMVGAYVFYSLSALLGVPISVSFIVAIASGVGMSLSTYFGIVKRFPGHPTAIFISTLILALVVQHAITVMMDPMARNLLPLLSGISHLAGTVTVSNNLIISMVVSWIALGSLLLFIKRTHLGRAIRAISEDPKGAIVSGIDIERANLVTWIWAGALAAIGGIFYGSYTMLVPHMWLFPLIMAFAIVIVGGIGSIEGTLIAAYIVGMSETAMTMLIAEQLRGVFGMAIMIGILVARPRGLLGKEA